MDSLIVTIESLPYAHRLHGYAGRCSRVHGHNARIEVCVSADALDSQGFVVDFYEARAALTRVTSSFDHSLIVSDADPLVGLMCSAGEHVVAFHVPPTAEHLARWVLEQMRRESRVCSPPGRPWRVEWASWQEEPGFVARVS